MKKSIRNISVIIAAIALFSGCAATDVVLKYSKESFKEITTEYPELVSDTTATDHYYQLSADDATFLKVSNDYALTGTYDVEIVTPAQPFVAAGLDINKLSQEYSVEGENFILAADYGNGSGSKSDLTDAFFESTNFDRSVLSYHAALDHYGISLNKGKFEFAKDITKNDKDLVFVLAAQPIADMGVDVQNVEGWIFMTMENEDGSKTDVLLKPYDLSK